MAWLGLRKGRQSQGRTPSFSLSLLCVVHLDGQELCEMSGGASSSDGETSVGSLLNGLSTQISNGLGALQTQLTENMSELKGNISELKGNITELRDQVNTNNQQITELRGQVNTNHQQTSGQMHAQYQGLMGVARGIQGQADTLENLIHRKARKTKAQLEQIQSTLKTVDRKQGVVQQA